MLPTFFHWLILFLRPKKVFKKMTLYILFLQSHFFEKKFYTKLFLEKLHFEFIFRYKKNNETFF